MKDYLQAGLVCQEVLELHQNVGHNIPQAHPFLLSGLDLHALPSVHSNGRRLFIQRMLAFINETELNANAGVNHFTLYA